MNAMPGWAELSVIGVIVSQCARSSGELALALCFGLSPDFLQ